MKIVWAFGPISSIEYVIECPCGQEFYQPSRELRVRCPHCKRCDSLHAIMAKKNPREGYVCRTA